MVTESTHNPANAFPSEAEPRLVQTARRSRAPVSDDGCRNLDMARASI